MLATRELYEWLRNWKTILKNIEQDGVNHEFVLPSLEPPDTNVLIFCVKEITHASLERMNNFTERVHESFAISVEHGERKYSYAQPFFLSKTTLMQPEYSFETFAKFFEKIEISEARVAYKKNGLVVLRATVMNPYIYSTKNLTYQNLIHEFVVQLHQASDRVWREMNRT